jgi:hypothetical protein
MSPLRNNYDLLTVLEEQMQKTSIKVGHRHNPKELEAIFSVPLVAGP